ncbi:MAG: T9SS type A sorting domain-containing protein [Bacteroidales bacterium]|jgi:photosystem II stability/assembly factor-like uncharacterized protein
MKTFILTLILISVALLLLITSFFILRKKEDAREKHTAFLIESTKHIDIPVSGSDGKSPDAPHLAIFQDFLQTVDPAEQRVPVERLYQAYVKIRAEQQESLLKAGRSLQWNIVPSNMGGRARVVMYDPNDAGGNKAWTGGVTGGLWYNNDITSSFSAWIPVGDFWPSLAISSITYDPNDPMTFYVGTGEAFTARVIYRESSAVGAGIFKSSDGGQSWQQIPSTLDWRFVTDIAVRDENGNSVIYAGVASGIYHGSHQSQPSDGLYRSFDGGQTWMQVLPIIAGTNHPYAVADIEITAGNRIMVGTMPNLNNQGGASILYSDQGIIGTWTVYDDYVAIIQSNPDYYVPNRVMLASAPSDPDIVYALLDAGYINSSNGFVYTRGRYILRSDNAGLTWISKPVPTGGDYHWATIGWHALAAGVDPNDPDALFIGGLDVYKSTNGGNNWTQVSDWRGMYYGGGDDYVHADIHDFEFKPGSSDELLVSTDGGIFYTNQASVTLPVFQEKNLSFGSLQFYTCAIHPGAGSVEYVGGLQDNGTLFHTGTPLTILDMIDGGDGAYCFIDENEPQYMITSYYYNRYTLFLNGNWYKSMTNWSSGTFISPADYDYRNNAIYANACSFGGSQANQILRIRNIPSNPTGNYLNLNTGLNVYFSAVKYSPHSPAGTANLFVGSLNGRLFRVQNAQGIPQATEITGNDFPPGAISSIAIGGSDDTLLVTFSNYGISSVWQTYDGGSAWEEKEANLPDMPVRWAIYHPSSSKHAMLATELGVWTTSNLDEEETIWTQDIEGMANVRVDMLQIRKSDYTVLAATHGRGLATAIWDIQTGISQPEMNLVAEVYPNPTTGKFKVQSSKFKVAVCKVELVDMQGKTIELLSNGIAGNETLSFDISHLPAGQYFLKITAGNEVAVKKLIRLD